MHLWSRKSTIARLIASLWEMKDGAIELGSVDIRQLPLKDCIDRIAYVSQDNYLFDLSMMDNIRMGERGQAMKRLLMLQRNAAAMRSSWDWKTLSDDARDIWLTLSGGKHQRIFIARAILKDAPIVILDEATANVDPENEKELMEAVSELAHDKTVIMIAHRLKTVQNTDRIFAVDHGKIVQQGIHDELVAADWLYRGFVVERKQASKWKV